MPPYILAKFQHYRPTFGTGLCNLHVFLTIFTALYGWNNLFSRDVKLQKGLIYPQLLLKHIAKLKKSFRLVVLGYTWYFLIWGGLSLAPNPGKLKFLIGFLSKSSQYNINVWYELSFLWKSEPDWWSLSGVLDWCAIWSPPRYLHFQYMYFGPVMYFLRNILVESHLVAPSLANNMVFSLKFVLLCQFKYILMQPHRSEFGASWSQYCQP